MWSEGLSNTLLKSWDREPREALSFPKVILGGLGTWLRDASSAVAEGIGRGPAVGVEDAGRARGDWEEGRETGRDAEPLCDIEVSPALLGLGGSKHGPRVWGVDAGEPSVGRETDRGSPPGLPCCVVDGAVPSLLGDPGAVDASAPRCGVWPRYHCSLVIASLPCPDCVEDSIASTCTVLRKVQSPHSVVVKQVC